MITGMYCMDLSGAQTHTHTHTKKHHTHTHTHTHLFQRMTLNYISKVLYATCDLNGMKITKLTKNSVSPDRTRASKIFIKYKNWENDKRRKQNNPSKPSPKPCPL